MISSVIIIINKDKHIKNQHLINDLTMIKVIKTTSSTVTDNRS